MEDTTKWDSENSVSSSDDNASINCSQSSPLSFNKNMIWNVNDGRRNIHVENEHQQSSGYSSLHGSHDSDLNVGSNPTYSASKLSSEVEADSNEIQKAIDLFKIEKILPLLVEEEIETKKKFLQVCSYVKPLNTKSDKYKATFKRQRNQDFKENNISKQPYSEPFPIIGVWKNEDYFNMNGNKFPLNNMNDVAYQIFNKRLKNVHLNTTFIHTSNHNNYELFLDQKVNAPNDIDFHPSDAFTVRRPTGRPKPIYKCNICHYFGDHYIYDCPLGYKNKQNGQTPYQGKKDCLGEYKCSKCKRVWYSVKSGANIKQNCKKCKIEEFPVKQFDLDDLIVKAKKTIKSPTEKFSFDKYNSPKEYNVLMHVYKTSVFPNL